MKKQHILIIIFCILILSVIIKHKLFVIMAIVAVGYMMFMNQDKKELRDPSDYIMERDIDIKTIQKELNWGIKNTFIIHDVKNGLADFFTLYAKLFIKYDKHLMDILLDKKQAILRTLEEALYDDDDVTSTIHKVEDMTNKYILILNNKYDLLYKYPQAINSFQDSYVY